MSLESVRAFFAAKAPDIAVMVSPVSTLATGMPDARPSAKLEISKAREEAEQALGQKFDIKQFHDRVLEDGAIPVSFLHEKIKAWVAK